MMSLNYQMIVIQCPVFKILLSMSLKKNEKLPTSPLIHIYINRINNRLMLKIKDGYKLELQIPESMKLFASTKKLTDKTKNRENIPSIEVVEIVLVQCTEAGFDDMTITFTNQNGRPLEIKDNVHLTMLFNK